MPLDKETINALLQAKLKPKPAKPKQLSQHLTSLYGVPPQKGPLKRYDKEMRCTSRRCGSPTYYKVEGMPLCTVHALKMLNELIVEMTEWREAMLKQAPLDKTPTGDEQLTLA